MEDKVSRIKSSAGRLRISTNVTHIKISAMTDNKPTSAEAILDGAQDQAQAPSEPGEIARQHDLLQRLIPHLDRHLVFPLLEFMSSQDNEGADEVTSAKYELLKQTNMTDYVANLWQELYDTDDVPEEFVKKREDVLQRLQQYMEESAKITELLENPDVVNNLRSDKIANLQFLKDQHGVCTVLAISSASVLTSLD